MNKTLIISVLAVLVVSMFVGFAIARAPNDDYGDVECDVEWEGYVYNDVTEECELVSTSGCENPYEYVTEEDCEETQKVVSECAEVNEQYSKVFTSEYLEVCCEGLTEWESGMDTRKVVNDECIETGEDSGYPVGICIDCGDGICEGFEDICNCPEDCKEIGEGCANSPDPDSFCEEDERLVIEGYYDGCPIWECEEEDEEIEFECCALRNAVDNIDGSPVYRWLREGDCAEEVDKSNCASITRPADESSAFGHTRYKYKYLNAEGVEIEREARLEKGENNRWQIRAERYFSSCGDDCELTMEGEYFKAKFSNGREALIKIMPDVAAERALERLGLVNCIEEEGCTIELKDVGQGEALEEGEEIEEEAELVYELKRDRDARVFGFIKTRMHVRAHVDADTGEVVKVKKAWWAFLASEPQEIEEELETEQLV